MKAREFSLNAALVGLSSQTNSAGTAVTLVLTVQDSVLVGYSPNLTAGW